MFSVNRHSIRKRTRIYLPVPALPDGNLPYLQTINESELGILRSREWKIQKFRIQFLQGQVNMMEIVEEYSIIIYNIYIIYNNTTISQSDVWQP